MHDADMKTRLKELYLPPADDFVLLEVPAMRFAMIDGRGAADRAGLDHAVKWLFAVIHPVKQVARRRMGKDFVEPPLEGLWWADDVQDFIAAGALVPPRTPRAGSRSRAASHGAATPPNHARNANLARAKLNWRMMIVFEDLLGLGSLTAGLFTQETFDDAVAAARERLGDPPESLRLERYHEGLCAQIMHVGPPAAEAATIARLHQEFLPARGLVPTGYHHEIYLTDPNRTAPERMRTVMRQPVRPSA